MDLCIFIWTACWCIENYMFADDLHTALMHYHFVHSTYRCLYLIPFVEPPFTSNTRHYSDVKTSVLVAQITGVSIVYSTVFAGADQRKHQSSASPAFVRGIHRWPVNSPHKGLVLREMFPLDNVIMSQGFSVENSITSSFRWFAWRSLFSFVRVGIARYLSTALKTMVSMPWDEIMALHLQSSMREVAIKIDHL